MIEYVRLTVLIEDLVMAKDAAEKRLIAKHGLSILVEAKSNNTNFCILLDAGPSSEALLNNIDAIGVNLRKIDAVVLSHGHYDHANGLIGVLKSLGKPVPVLAHPKAFNPKFSMKPKLKSIGSAFTLSAIENAGGVPLLAENSVKIFDDITTTGEIKRVTYEKSTGFFTVENGHFMEDPILDDQALIINIKNKGLIIITGCAHAGVINTVRCAQKIMKQEKVYAVLGGFHLIDATPKQIQMTIDDLKTFNLKFLGPCHCTGRKAISKFKEAFGDRCKLLKTGDVLTL